MDARKIESASTKPCRCPSFRLLARLPASIVGNMNPKPSTFYIVGGFEFRVEAFGLRIKWL